MQFWLIKKRQMPICSSLELTLYQPFGVSPSGRLRTSSSLRPRPPYFSVPDTSSTKSGSEYLVVTIYMSDCDEVNHRPGLYQAVYPVLRMILNDPVCNCNGDRSE